MMACVLAAGRGLRLGGRELPKGFVDLGDGPLIERSLQLLFQHGIPRVVLVTGHQAHYYEELAARDERLTCVHNPRYAEAGTLLSLACARGHLPEDFLLLESDLLYEARALTALLDSSCPDQILTSGRTGAGDEVWVEAPHGRLARMSKRPAELARLDGEFTGLSRVSRELYQALLQLDPERGDYECEGLVACARRFAIRATCVPDLTWAEVDDENQLERARGLLARV